MTTPADAGFSGVTEPGPFSAADDRRFSRIDLWLQGLGSEPGGLTDARDPFRAAGQRLRALAAQPVCFGVIVQALPTLHWYKVQLGQGGGSVPCCRLTSGSPLPIGTHDAGMLPPNAQVVVYKPAELPVGIILGAVPVEVVDAGRQLGDRWMQGTNCGLLREQAYRFLVQGLANEGGIRDWSSHRPPDGTAFEQGLVSSTGIALLVDDFQAFLRVNEACGLFLNHFDSHARLAGLQLDIQSLARIVSCRDDEGECRSVDRNLVYPWEALGLYAPGTPLGQAFLGPDGRPLPGRGSYDLPEGAETTSPVARGTDYGGYLGQGWQRFLGAPLSESGRHLRADGIPLAGLYHEHVALDGSASIRTAKSWMVSKRQLIPVPEELRDPEDPSGDTSATYRASSLFGNGAPHRVGDVADAGDPLQRVAGVLDLLAYAQNWKGLHPFHYHAGDFALAEESALGRSQEPLDYSLTPFVGTVPAPVPTLLRVDHRYGDVKFYARESLIALLDDGSVVLGCGNGARIALTEGRILLDAPGDILLQSGRQLVGLGSDVVLRAQRSLDASAAQGDLRLKADGNMQLVSGNSGSGGLLLENKAVGIVHEYRDRFGEAVVDSGIVLLSRVGEIGLLGGDVLLRTGGPDLRAGSIVLDSDQGRGQILQHAENLLVLVSEAVQVWHPTGDEIGFQEIRESHRLGRDSSKIDGSLLLGGSLLIPDGSVAVAKDVVVQGNVAAEGVVAGNVPDLGLEPTFDAAAESDAVHLEIGAVVLQSQLAERWYASGALGSDEVVASLGFSFRDPPGYLAGSQYRTQSLRLPEPRWQQLVRSGAAAGGTPWIEPPVVYQGQPTMPWPGLAAWTSATLASYSDHRLYSPEAGRAVDRGAAYEAAELGSLEYRVPANDYLVLV